MSAKIEVDEKTIYTIKNLFSEGKSISQISSEIGYGKGVINRIILENDFKKGSKEHIIPYEEIYSLYVTQKMPMRKVAKVLNLPYHQVQLKLKEYKIPSRCAGSDPIGITEELLKNLYFNKKMKQKEIAKELNCSVSTISKYFIRYGIGASTNRYTKPIRTRNIKLSKEDEKQIIKMCLEGKSTKEIAAYFGCSRSTASRKISAVGLFPKRYTLENISFEEFYSLCIKKNKNLKDIAIIYHVSKSTVQARMRQINFSIEKERRKIRQEKTTKEVLEDLYFNQNMTEEEIAHHLKIGRGFISKKFKEYNIYKEPKYKHITKEILEDLYVKQNIAPCFIADKFNCSPCIIQQKIKRFQLRKNKTEKEIKSYRAKAYERSLNTKRSKGEKEIEAIFPTPYHNIHSIINLELDLWYPEQKVAIEYNGDYWHSIKFPQNSGLHLAKLSMCKNKGIHLINIFERDWHASKTKKLLKVHLTRILKSEKLNTICFKPTRCFIFETKQFENKYNIEGSGEGQKAVGIKKDDKLIATLSYIIKDGYCIISRYTTHSDYNEDYTSLILYLKKREGLPIKLRYDNRYYNTFPCNLEPLEATKIPPELFYVKSRKALRKEEASSAYLSHSKCKAVYDCGYTEIIL